MSVTVVRSGAAGEGEERGGFRSRSLLRRDPAGAAPEPAWVRLGGKRVIGGRRTKAGLRGESKSNLRVEGEGRAQGTA